MVDEDLNGKMLDFVFIDAKHTYHDLYADLSLWESSVREGGIVAGHDFGHESYPGIEKAVREFFLGKTINLEDGYVWWVQV